MKDLWDLPFSSAIGDRVLRYHDRLSGEFLTLGDIASIPSFGPRRTIEFACVLEATLVDPQEFPDDGGQNSPELQVIPPPVTTFFQTLGAYARGELNQDTLAESLPLALDTWPPEIQQLWAEVCNLNSQEIAGNQWKRYSVSDLIARVLVRMDGRIWKIMLERTLAIGTPAPLDAISHRYKIT